MRAPISKLILTEAQIARLSGRKIAAHMRRLREGERPEVDVRPMENDQLLVVAPSRNLLMAYFLTGARTVPIAWGS